MSDLAHEFTRRTTARDRVLAALEAAGPRGCRNVDLCRPAVGGLRAMARVHELQRDGLDISVVREGAGGIWRVTLHGTRPADPTTATATPAPEAGWLF